MCVYIAIQTGRQLNNVKRRATFPSPSPAHPLWLATTTVATAAPSPFPALCLPSGAVNQPVELAALLPCCPRLSQTNHNCYNLLKAELGRRRKGERGRVRESEGGRGNCSKSIKLQGSAPAVAAVFCVMFARANRTMRASIDSQREVEKREWGRGGLLSWLSTFIN